MEQPRGTRDKKYSLDLVLGLQPLHSICITCGKNDWCKCANCDGDKCHDCSFETEGGPNSCRYWMSKEEYESTG